MLIEKDEVIIAVSLHEMDFVSVLRAARLLGTTRENIIRQAVANYLVQLQKEGLDVGIQLPPEPKPEEAKPENTEPKSEKEKATKGRGNGKE